MDDLLRFLFKAVDVSPRYRPDLCLAVKQSVSACSVCRDVCPHEAITIRGRVEIDTVDCSGCGLCVQSCPSQALDSSARYQPGAPLRCSQVRGQASSVLCLGRLRAGDLLHLAGQKRTVRLVRNDCEDCPIGAGAIAEAIEVTRQEALELARLRSRPLDIEVEVRTTFDDGSETDGLSRRDLLRGGWRNLQQGMAELLAPLDPGGDEDDSLPHEMQTTFHHLAAAALEPEAAVPWVLPRVASGCIMCPVCTRVCPTKAFRREFDPPDEEGTQLLLQPERCMGCNACVKACPVKVITLDEEVTWGELSGGTSVAYHRKPHERPEGGVPR